MFWVSKNIPYNEDHDTIEFGVCVYDTLEVFVDLLFILGDVCNFFQTFPQIQIPRENNRNENEVYIFCIAYTQSIKCVNEASIE